MPSAEENLFRFESFLAGHALEILNLCSLREFTRSKGISFYIKTNFKIAYNACPSMITELVTDMGNLYPIQMRFSRCFESGSCKYIICALI